jgi:NAD(P)-dependent dehydrogenase (short-subunit alcohol dehydrogenase family)
MYEHSPRKVAVITGGSIGIGLATAKLFQRAGGKAVVRSMARSVASELEGPGTRVDVVSPGPIATPIYGKLGLPKEAVDAFAANIVSQVPLTLRQSRGSRAKQPYSWRVVRLRMSQG